MKRTIFRLETSLRTDEALARLVKLLEDESVIVDHRDDRIWSLSTPLPLINVDRRLYSRRNWVGINPFVFITSIEIHCDAGSSDRTLITVTIDRSRMMFLLAIAAVTAIAVAIQAPIGVSVAITAFLLGFCMLLFRLSYSLVRGEIERHVQG